MNRKPLLRIVAALAAVVVVAACGSGNTGSKPGTGNQGASGGEIKLGLLADLTGGYSSSFKSAEGGLKAYVQMINDQGGINGSKLSYVVADTTSTLPGAQTAAQQLVEKEKVFAIVEVSAVYSGAQTYLLRQGIPVAGGGFDGNEWTDPHNTNLFASTGATDYKAVASVTGQFMKSQGVTSCGAVGYASSPSAIGAASSVVKSCEAAGLKNGYLNTQLAPGSTDVGPIALAMKQAGVDGIDVLVVPNTAFALVAALKQAGVTPKAILLPTGYGSDLLASPPTVQAAQGFIFQSVGQPVEANTPATQKQVAALAKVGITSSPTFAQQESYIAAATVAAGLRAAGNNPTQKSFTDALRKVNNFDADGLLAPGKVDFNNFSQTPGGAGAAGCLFAARVQGDKFVPVEGLPLCGGAVPGVSN
ncbi:MAG TPA: ABC transporter substrate-binding protein [Amycolatopsis sp.]|nr:ABC transporter substrate-binding protein [Amycolatopsis sp.]